MPDATPLLELRDMTVAYGAIVGVRGLSLRVQEGEIVALLGANGAGKSSTLRGISGLAIPKSGEVLLAGERITGLSAEQRVTRGLSLTPEGRRVFPSLTVGDNLRMGGATRSRDEAAATLERALAWFPVLRSRYGQRAGSLSGGEQQQLAIARALLSRPRLLILDEPSLGLAPIMIDRVYAILSDLKRRGVTLLLIEQNPGRIGEVADRIVVLASGTVQLEGPATEVLSSGRLGAAYLGESAAA